MAGHDYARGAHMTPWNLPTFVCDPLYGQVTKLNGSTQYWQVASAALTGTPLTLACWFRSTTITANQGMVWIGDGTVNNSYWMLYAGGGISGDPVCAYSIGGVNSGYAKTSAGYGANVWNHAAGVYHHATSRAAFLNGRYKGTSATSISPPTINRMAAGRDAKSGPGMYFNGSLADVRVYNRALCDAEIMELADPAARWQLYRPTIRFWVVQEIIRQKTVDLTLAQRSLDLTVDKRSLDLMVGTRSLDLTVVQRSLDLTVRPRSLDLTVQEGRPG
jgi:hypothetical protein